MPIDLPEQRDLESTCPNSVTWIWSCRRSFSAWSGRCCRDCGRG